MNNEKKFIKLTPFKMQVLQSFPFIDEDFDAITNYELLCKVVEYLNKTVDNVDLLNEKVEEFENYFDNLDVQEEINNKLDEMAESGELTDIIAQYLELAGVLAFNTVNDMKNATNLVNGSIVITKGYYSPNDGGQAEYIIKSTSSIYYEELTNNLIAELIVKDNTISAKQLGCYGDNEHDDTEKLQYALDYCVTNNIKLLLNGIYKVSPSLKEDNTKVCLTLSRITTMWSKPCEIEFVSGSYITTNSEESCTLLRMNASNMLFKNLFLTGGEDVDLLQLSRINLIDTTETLYNNRNSFIDTKLSGGNQALELQGGAYYNTFNKMTINGSKNAILLGFTQLEKNGTQNDPSTNRNDFLNVTILNVTNNGLRIEYGDTNKFIDLNFEGVKNPIYIDDPQLHTSDFTIAPKYYPYDNMFVNVSNEQSSGIVFYNNCRGTKVINISSRFIKDNCPIIPQVYIGGATTDQSVQIFGPLYNQTTSSKVYPSSVNNSTVNSNSGGFTSTTYYDFIPNGDSDIIPLIKTNTTFDLPNNSNITKITYETNDKVLFKSIGNIIHISGKFRFTPTDNTQKIVINYPTEYSWIKSQTSVTSFSSLPALEIPIVVLLNDKYKFTHASVYNNRIEISAPDGNWLSTDYNFVFINISVYRDREYN